MKAHFYAGFIGLSAVTVGTALMLLTRMTHEETHSQAEWNQLNAKVERLEKTTTALQAQLRAFQNPVPVLLPRPLNGGSLPTTPNLTFPNDQAPPGSTPFVFNGVTYYITPLAEAR